MMDAADLPVDVAKLAPWLRQQGLGESIVTDIRALTGGTQNILLAFRYNGQSMVLRRPPLHAQTDGNVVIEREARILSALAATDVPHPRFIAGCKDTGLLGAAFYVMEAVDGFNPHQHLPAPFSADPDLRWRMGMSLVDTIARLGAQDYLALGLGDFGRPEGFLGRQVKRWRAQLDGYSRYEGWPGLGGLGDIDTVGRWLDEQMPPEQRPGIIHGDVHLANLLFRHDAPEVTALVDWELSTIGDPLVDLGWLLGHWPDQQGNGLATTGVRPWEGFPTKDMLIERYAERSGRDVRAISWYAVLACYKRAAIIEGTYARACAGMFSMDTGEELHRRAVALVARAEAFIAG
jgi:aminoglycoside phosphotransferase (APT) family kinase protein